ncbi:MAG: amino acid ABC transporter permease [Methanobacteriota archaeon]|nr:MAG: amino acid ABC transporter permease [Euryarchaeota archaeon]
MVTTVGAASRQSFDRGLTLRTLQRAAEMTVGAILFIVILELVLHFDILDSTLWGLYGPSYFLSGIFGTLQYLAIIIPLSVAIGFSVGWARLSRFRVLTWPLSVYVDFFRGMPPIILVIFASLLGPSLVPARFHSQGLGILMGALALGLHSGAYQSEIFRAGFMSVPRGQLEAAESLGMTFGQAMHFVVLPQALRLSVPPLANELAVVIKDTSLLAIIGALDLFGLSNIFSQQAVFGSNQLWWVFVVWTAVALVYFVMTFSVTELLNWIDRRYHVKGLEAVSV